LFLAMVLLNAIVYQQYQSTLPLTVSAGHLDVFWYTVAVSLNGVVVIALELPATKVMQRLPPRVPIAIGFALVGIGVAFYGLPLVAFVVLTGTLLWSFGEIVSAPSLFAYPAIAGAGPMKSRYVGSLQFVVGIGSTLAPLVGGWLFIQIGPAAVWPALGAVEVLVAVAMLGLVRTPHPLTHRARRRA